MTKRELSLDLVIPASPERVWNALTAFQEYPEWLDGHTIDGAAEALSVVKITTRIAGDAKPQRATCVIWKFEPNARLEFFSGRAFLNTKMRFFELMPSGAGTRLRHGMRFAGILRRSKSTEREIEHARPRLIAFAEALSKRSRSATAIKPGGKNRRARRAARSKGH
jgi:uncharacterized protein YndB with AHSA1/START domain